MKRRAILYIRVSTDEQTNGYSPADQEERLLRYCQNENIIVVKIYYEDESAKDFGNRPEWQKIFSFIKGNKNTVDIVLFTKWDRFSRNAAEAYITIRDLKKYNVEPQAIEQPLDFSIPESKIMLAVYLAAPEVDNDRRALNTFNGMRKARKLGRWVTAPLRGYKMGRDENNKPIMVPEGGKQEKLIRLAFTEFADGLYTIEELRKKLNKEGLKCSRNQFWTILRNKSYTGKIFVPAYKDEAEKWINAIHEPLVSEQIFERVQEALKGRKQKRASKAHTHQDELPLRGFMACPQCGKNMTGSGSKGNGGRFFYYHCSKGCKERRKASEINDIFESILLGFKSDKDGIRLYGEILKQDLKADSQATKAQILKINTEVEKLNNRLKNARILMLDGELTAQEYKESKADIEEQLNRLKIEQAELVSEEGNTAEEIDFCTTLLQNIDFYYDIADMETKQLITGSVFPNKLVFDGKMCRTEKIEDAVALLCLNSKGSGNKKTKKHPIFEVLSCMVASTGIEPVFKV